jgi:hypothetical protein
MYDAGYRDAYDGYEPQSPEDEDYMCGYMCGFADAEHDLEYEEGDD